MKCICINTAGNCSFCPKRCGGTVLDHNWSFGENDKRVKSEFGPMAFHSTFENTSGDKTRTYKSVCGLSHSTFGNTQGGKSNTGKSKCGPKHSTISTFENTQRRKVKHRQKV